MWISLVSLPNYKFQLKYDIRTYTFLNEACIIKYLNHLSESYFDKINGLIIIISTQFYIFSTYNRMIS